MPLQERFGARPMWACLVACPVSEITSFVADSSRSRKSVFGLDHIGILRVVRIEAPASANCKRKCVSSLREFGVTFVSLK
jgi:nitrate reductase beta subunit